VITKREVYRVRGAAAADAAAPSARVARTHRLPPIRSGRL